MSLQLFHLNSLLLRKRHCWKMMYLAQCTKSKTMSPPAPWQVSADSTFNFNILLVAICPRPKINKYQQYLSLQVVQIFLPQGYTVFPQTSLYLSKINFHFLIFFSFIINKVGGGNHSMLYRIQSSFIWLLH